MHVERLHYGGRWTHSRFYPTPPPRLRTESKYMLKMARVSHFLTKLQSLKACMLFAATVNIMKTNEKRTFHLFLLQAPGGRTKITVPLCVSTTTTNDNSQTAKTLVVVV